MTDLTAPLILAIDTAQEDCAAALMRGTELLAQTVEPVGSCHSERILPMIRDLLAGAHVEKSDLDLVAFGAGPGSFTGLRVACGVAQGLAWALEVETAPVSNLEAQAEWLRAEHGLAAGTVIAVLNDARMHECYAGVWRVPADPAARLEFVAGPEQVAPAAAAAYVERHGASVVVGSAHKVYGDEMALPAALCIEDDFHARPAAICRIARHMALADELVTPELAHPVYVRNRVALTIAQRAAGERLQ